MWNLGTPRPIQALRFRCDENGASNVEVETTNSLGMKLRLIPPGGFVGDDNIEAPLLVGTDEVTIAQFRKFVEATGYESSADLSALEQGRECFNWRNPGIVQDSDQHPVVRVSWRDTQAFCRWLGDTEQQSYRIPTVAEWAFAARAGLATRIRIKQPASNPRIPATFGLFITCLLVWPG